MAKTLRRTRGWLARQKPNLRGVLAIAGIAAIAQGLLLLHPTLAWLAVGVYLLAAAAAPTDPKAR